MPEELRLTDKGQERQEAKTRICQDDQRQETFEKGKGPQQGTFQANG